MVCFPCPSFGNDRGLGHSLGTAREPSPTWCSTRIKRARARCALTHLHDSNKINISPRCYLLNIPICFPTGPIDVSPTPAGPESGSSGSSWSSWFGGSESKPSQVCYVSRRCVIVFQHRAQTLLFSMELKHFRNQRCAPHCLLAPSHRARPSITSLSRILSRLHQCHLNSNMDLGISSSRCRCITLDHGRRVPSTKYVCQL